MVRLCSSSWAWVRLVVLPVTHGEARNHGRFYGILMEFPNSVADLGRGVNSSHFVGVRDMANHRYTVLPNESGFFDSEKLCAFAPLRLCARKLLTRMNGLAVRQPL